MKFHGIVVWRLMGSGQDGVSLCHGLEAAGVWMDGDSVCMACGLSESRMNAVSFELWSESKLVQTQERVAFCCKHAILLFGCNLGIPGFALECSCFCGAQVAVLAQVTGEICASFHTYQTLTWIYITPFDTYG